MSLIVSLSGSPSLRSRTDGVLSHINRRLAGAGHEVRPVVLRDLPPRPLLAGDTADPEIAAAIEVLARAEAVVVGSPVFQAAYSGLTKVFLDLLPQFAFAGKSVLPILTGGSAAHVLALDYALRPVLTSLGARHISQGWFVAADQVRLYDDGGVLLTAAASAPLYDVTDAFLYHLSGATPTDAPARPGGGADTVDPAAVAARRVAPDDPVLAPLLRDLVVEYGTRYSRITPNSTLTEVPATDFAAPDGTFVILTVDDEVVAGGALRRKDSETAEVKRVWTSNRHRRRGLAKRLMSELEQAALDLGYRRIYLTTGPRQPEARGLYLAAGYQPQFDLTADPETIGPLPFTKTLAPSPAVVTGCVPQQHRTAGAMASLSGARR